MSPLRGKLHIGLLGGSGRMGEMIRKLAEGEFSREVEIAHAPTSKQDLSVVFDSDVVIDFSLPEAWQTLLPQAEAKARAGEELPPMVVGSTGWVGEKRKTLERLGELTTVVQSNNFSLGVFLLGRALERVGREFLSLGFQASIVESHHVHKKDAPSGTALTLQKKVSPLDAGRVPIRSIREGETIGEHEVIFQTAGETVKMSHSASSREIFAHGAILVALKLSSQSQVTGLLSLDDFFGSDFI